MTTSRWPRTPSGRPILRRPRLPTTVTGRRTLTLTVAYLLVLLLVVLRLVDVQVLDGDRYAEQGQVQRAQTVELAPQRGRIYDRTGEVLATSITAATVYADPRKFRPSRGPDGQRVPPEAQAGVAAASLARVLDRPPREILRLLRRDKHFVYLGRALDWEVGERVLALDIPGVGVYAEPQRVFPAGQLAGTVLGFVGADGEGLGGLEQQHDSLLRGRPGLLGIERSGTGLPIASGTRTLVPPEPGTDLVLTLDREIQHTAERVAERTRVDNHAIGASIVVLDVDSGEILAMASAPGFDPNGFRTSDAEHRRNRAIAGSFEPGSVQKAITAAAAIEEGVVRPTTRMLVPDALVVGGHRFSDSHSHEPERMTFREVIETSSNVGTIMVAQRLGADRLHAYLREFGYGQRLGLGFPGEQGGALPPVEAWWSTSLPTIAIGQGVAVNLVQLASFYATLANDGLAVQPRVLRGTVGEDGRVVAPPPPATRQVVSPRTARTVRSILADVISGERGTGSRAAVPGYDVAGKTGTAKKPAEDARGYSTEYRATFVGMAPVDDPELVVAVMVDEPDPIWGGVVAAPAFAEVMGFALRHRNVPAAQTEAPLEEALADAAAEEAAYRARLAQEAAERRQAERARAIERRARARARSGGRSGGQGTTTAPAGGADAELG